MLSSFLWCIRSFSSSFRASESVVICHEGRSLLCNAPTLVGHDEISFFMRYQEESIMVPAMDSRSHLRRYRSHMGAVIIYPFFLTPTLGVDEWESLSLTECKDWARPWRLSSGSHIFGRSRSNLSTG